jgi:hypothetical protein
MRGEASDLQAVRGSATGRTAPGARAAASALLAATLVSLAVGVVNSTIGTAYASAAQPAVTSVKPSSGPATGGTLVYIKGANFSEASAVQFGYNSATSFTVEPGLIKATSPAGSGTVDVTVTTPGGTSSTGSADHFSYLPVVTSVSPTSGPDYGGTTVTITGIDFSGATAVKFGSTDAASFTVDSATSITAISPAEAVGQVGIRVTAPQGTSRNSSKDTFKFTPTVTGVSPGSGPPAGGTTVTITGSGFAVGDTATNIALGGQQATSVKCTTTTACTAITPELLRGQEYSNPVDVRATVNHIASPKTTADQFHYHGLYLLYERRRLRVGESFTLHMALGGPETEPCYAYLSATVTANGETTDELATNVAQYTNCVVPDEWSGVLPGTFTLRINSDQTANIEGGMGVRTVYGCVYEADKMSGGFEIGGTPFGVGVGGAFTFVAEEEPGAECSATESVGMQLDATPTGRIGTELVR